MTPYRVYIRVYADRGGPCTYALTIARTRDDGEDVKRCAPRRLDTRSVYTATLRAARHALDLLVGRDAPVVLYTNNTAIAGVLTGAMMASTDADLVEACRAQMGDRARVELILNRAADPHMERTYAAAMEAARG